MLLARYSRPLLILLALILLASPSAVAAQQPPTAPPPDPRFGVVEAFWMPEEATKLGVGWERIIFYWNDLQPRGPNDWTGYFPNSVIDSERKAGRQIVGLLIGTPAWAATPETAAHSPRSVPAGLDLPVDDPGNYWARFVRQIVGHYRGKIDHWIIWNEPDVWGEAEHGSTWTGTEADYYLLLKNAYLAAKSVNPEATILFSGLTYWWDARYQREQYLERVLRVADADPTAREHGYYFDVLPLHLYHVVPYVPYVIGQYRQILARHGLDKPIWINEMNVVPYDDPVHPIPRIETRSTLEQQTHFLLQASALALAAGVERISVYKITDDQVMEPNLTEPYGLVRRDRKPRPAFDAYRTVIQHYAGTQAATEFVVGDVEGVLLDRGTQTTLVLWSFADRDDHVTIEVPTTRALTVEPTGAASSITVDDGQISMLLPRATREWVEGELAAFTIGGKPALLVLESPVDLVRIHASAGTVTLRQIAPGARAIVEVAPAGERVPGEETIVGVAGPDHSFLADRPAADGTSGGRPPAVWRFPTALPLEPGPTAPADSATTAASTPPAGIPNAPGTPAAATDSGTPAAAKIDGPAAPEAATADVSTFDAASEAASQP